jgi:hypothetical protein
MDTLTLMLAAGEDDGSHGSLAEEKESTKVQMQKDSDAAVGGINEELLSDLSQSLDPIETHDLLPTWYACHRGDFKLLKELVKLGIPVNMACVREAEIRGDWAMLGWIREVLESYRCNN